MMGPNMKSSSKSVAIDSIEASAIVRTALAEVAGAAIVLDDQFRIVDATAEAEELVGRVWPGGHAAPDFYCGDWP